MQPTFEFPVTSALEALPLYQANGLVHSMLEPLKEVMNSGNYFFRGVPIPRSGNTNIGARATYEEQISIPNGSYLLYMTAQSATPFTRFRFNIFETGSKRSIATEHIKAMVALPPPGFGITPFILPSPLVITREGQLGVSITNLSATAQECGLLLCFAVPKPQPEVKERG